MPPATITFELPSDVHDAVSAIVTQWKKPPRVTETGDTVIEPMFRSFEEWASQILAVNIAKILADNPTAEILTIKREIEDRQRLIEEMARPKVKGA